jgi:hypothetical protein
MKENLSRDNYLVVPALIDARRAEALAEEFLALERAGRYHKDNQAPNSPAAYNFLPLVRLLVQKLDTVAELCGEPLLPTYAYGRIYKHGEVLARHRDRDACEISLSLNLAQDTEWPFCIQKPDREEVALILKPGDAIMYLGCQAEHWRPRFTGRNYMQVFLHYVHADGPRAYAFFDRAKVAPDAQHQPTVPMVVPYGIDDQRKPTVGLGVADAGRPQGVVRGGQKVGRNEACPCGSGRKYKHCHGAAVR